MAVAHDACTAATRGACLSWSNSVWRTTCRMSAGKSLHGDSVASASSMTTSSLGAELTATLRRDDLDDLTTMVGEQLSQSKSSTNIPAVVAG